MHFKFYANKFLYLSSAFWFLILYIAATLMIGEFHPFSKFPMFSSFPDNSNYYYLADNQDMPIYNSRNTGIYCSEISDLMHAEISRITNNINLEEKEKNAAHKVLITISNRNKGSKFWKINNEIRLRKKSFLISDLKIISNDNLLSVWKRK